MKQSATKRPSIMEEMAAYRRIRHQLEEQHTGKWAVTKLGDLVGVFDTYDAALRIAANGGDGCPCLVWLIGTRTPGVPDWAADRLTVGH